MKLGIGTVQFGMKYGLTNHTDKTSLAEVKNIIETAQKYRIQIIDTAKSYGNSSSVSYLDLVIFLPIE